MKSHTGLAYFHILTSEDIDDFDTDILSEP